MPWKKGQFQGGHPRVPIRGMADIFRDLDPSIINRFRDIFAEAENLMDFHSRTVPQRQLRRKLSGLVDAPVVTVSAAVSGAAIRWERLDDKRISMYEVQLSDNNVFSSPETFTVIDTFFAVESLSTTKYIRVRGVRYDGLTGNWSNTVSASPEAVGPVIFTDIFYTSYGTQAEPVLEKTVRFAGAAVPTFYTLFATTFVPTEDVGGMMVWGQVSNRLKRDKNSNGRVWDTVRWRVNGITRMEQQYSYWTDPAVIDSDTPVVVGGIPIGFYGHGGYTAAFGPYMAQFPGMIRGEGFFDPRTVENFYIDGFDLSWGGTKFVKRPARYDLSPSNLLTSITSTADEAFAINIPPNRVTMFLGCTNFNFNVPQTATITGIEAKIKRRKSRRFFNPITTDLANYSPLKHLDATDSSVGSDNLVDVADYGTVVSVQPVTGGASNTDRLRADAVGAESTDTIGIANTWTISMWLSVDEAVAGAQKTLFLLGHTDTANNAILISPNLNAGATAGIQINNVSGGGQEEYTFTSGDTTLLNNGAIHHLVVRWDGSTVTAYIDGILKSLTLTNIAGGVTSMADTARNLFFGHLGNSAASAIDSSFGQVGIWNTVLTADEISTIFDSQSSVDLRSPLGAYSSHGSLKHYYFLFPDQGDVIDHSVHLITRRSGAPKIRQDWNNKALVESWPRFEKFNSDGTSDGIPHDNLIGMGYQAYGGAGDLWGSGGALTPTEINNFYFGVALAATNPSDIVSNGFVDHIGLLVYFTDNTKGNNVELTVEADGISFYLLEREMFGALFNGVQIAENFYIIP